MIEYERTLTPAGYTKIDQALLDSKTGTTDTTYELDMSGVQVVKNDIVWTGTNATYKRWAKINDVWTEVETDRVLMIGCYLMTEDNGKVNWGYCITSAVQVTQAYIDANPDSTPETSTSWDGSTCSIVIKDGVAELTNSITGGGRIPIDCYISKEDGAMFCHPADSFESIYQIKV